MKTSRHIAKMTKLAKTYALWKFESFLCNVVQLNIPKLSVVCAAQISKTFVKYNKMHPKRTTEQKVMAFRTSRISLRILCLSNHHGYSFSIQLLIDFAKTYEIYSSQCSNDQIVKNLWLLEVCNPLLQCYATQLCNAFDSLGHVDLSKLF